MSLWRIGLINYNCDKEHYYYYYYYYGESADREPKRGLPPDVQGHSEGSVAECRTAECRTVKMT